MGVFGLAWCNCCEKETGILYFKTVISGNGKKASFFVCDICCTELDSNEELIDKIIFRFNEKIAADIDELLRKLKLTE